DLVGPEKRLMLTRLDDLIVRNVRIMREILERHVKVRKTIVLAYRIRVVIDAQRGRDPQPGADAPLVLYVSAEVVICERLFLRRREALLHRVRDSASVVEVVEIPLGNSSGGVRAERKIGVIDAMEIYADLEVMVPPGLGEVVNDLVLRDVAALRKAVRRVPHAVEERSRKLERRRKDRQNGGRIGRPELSAVILTGQNELIERRCPECVVLADLPLHLR